MKTNADVSTTEAAAVAEQGATTAPEQATTKGKASKTKGAPKAKKTASKPAARKTPKAKNAAASMPREFSKRAVIIEMLHAKGGASLDEIVAKTSWQRHTVRGLLSTLHSKSGLAIERFERAGGGHAYRISK